MRTYSIGFMEEGFDEAPHARAVAAHLGTEHTELYVSPAEAREVIPDLPTIYDEPFAELLANSDLSPIEAHARARDRGAVGRWRR